MRLFILLLALCFAATLLAGCGQKGPLVMPRPSSTAPASTEMPPPSPLPASPGTSAAPGSGGY